MRTFFSILLGGCLLLALAPRGAAHFRLLEPESWLHRTLGSESFHENKSHFKLE